MEAIEGKKDSQPREDEMRIECLEYACEKLKQRAGSNVQGTHDWDVKVKVRRKIWSNKKGFREHLNNFRRVCSLIMGSWILVKVIAKHLGWWVEHLGL